MSPTTIVMPSVLRFAVAIALVAACGGTSNDGPDAATQCMPNSSAPTYSQLFTKYFAPGTPGHCATDGCHAGASFNIWLCGTTRDTCYAGMLGYGLIDTSNPLKSRLGDPMTSPLRWINPNGIMPFDAIMQFPEGRDAILAWIAACAPNN